MKFAEIWCVGEVLCKGKFSHFEWKLPHPPPTPRFATNQPCRASLSRIKLRVVFLLVLVLRMHFESLQSYVCICVMI